MVIPREIIIDHENDDPPFPRQQRNKQKCNCLASFRERHCHAFCLLYIYFVFRWNRVKERDTIWILLEEEDGFLKSTTFEPVFIDQNMNKCIILKDKYFIILRMYVQNLYFSIMSISDRRYSLPVDNYRTTESTNRAWNLSVTWCRSNAITVQCCSTFKY